MKNNESFVLKKTLPLKNLENFNDFKSINPLSEYQEIQIISEANYDGTVYKVGVAVAIDLNENLPVFAEIRYIIKSNEQVYFIVKKFCTSYLD